ncbi:MAG TPA: site-2 protease family protein [Acidimicrobiia bacterium]
MHGLRSVRVGSIDGIELKLDWSVLVIFWLLTWSLAAAGLPTLAPGYRAPEYWISALATTVAFFASLLAHELSHCVVARRQGLHVRDITLWLLGGVSTIEQEARTASADLRIAIVGPATSLALGFTGLAAAALFAATGLPGLLVACAVWLGSVNILLALFNIVPAAPLDGGRVLRAIRWRQTGDRTRGALAAAHAGRVFAFVLIALGFFEFLFGADVSGLWFVLLGWFLLSASHAEETQIHLNRDLATTRVRDLMSPDPITVRHDLTVNEVLHDYVLARHCSTFPVLDDRGRLAGLVTLGRLRSVPAARRESTRVSEIVWPVAALTVADPDELILDVLRRSTAGGDGRILACNADAVVGIVSPTDITRALQVADAEGVH